MSFPGHMLGLALEYLYGDLDERGGYDLRSGENGPYIAVWNLGTPMPSDAELTAAAFEARRDQKREEIAAAGRESLKGSGARNLDEAQIAAIGMTDEMVRYTLTAERKAQLEGALDGLQAVRSRWNTLLGKIEAATTHADLDAIHWEMVL